MSKKHKILKKMRNNPTDWQIKDLESLALNYGISVRKGKGSHVSFSHPNSVEIITVPAHRPIKPIYIKKFITLIDFLNRGEKHE